VNAADSVELFAHTG